MLRFPDFKLNDKPGEGYRLRRAYESRMNALAEARWLIRVCGFRL